LPILKSNRFSIECLTKFFTYPSGIKMILGKVIRVDFRI
jgi:hypothetical protein